MKCTHKLSILCIFSLFYGVSFAAPTHLHGVNSVSTQPSLPVPQMVNANDQIQNLESTLAQVKKETKDTVLFPTLIPKPDDSKKYYASRDIAPTQNGFSYWINVDSTPDCNGAKYCNTGSITARQNAKPEMSTDRNNKNITEPLTLTQGVKAYFTPGHPMGDYFPPNIQWSNNGVLYQLTWNVKTDSKAERVILMKMAESALATESNLVK